MFFKKKKSFKSQNIRPLKASKKKFNFKKKYLLQIYQQDFKRNIWKKKIITPSKKTTLFLAEAFLSASQLKEDILGTSNKSSFTNNNSPLLSGINGMIRMNNKIILNDENEKNILNNKNDVVKNSKKVLNSPSLFFEAKNNKMN